MPAPIVSDSSSVKHEFLLSGQICSLLLTLAALPIIAIMFMERLKTARQIRFNVASITLLASYITTFLFVYALPVIIHLRSLGQNDGLCLSTLLICLTLGVLAKMSTFAFLIERVYIISFPVLTPRHKHPEYILTYLGIFIPYIVATGLCIKYRIAYNNSYDVCIIGMKVFALLPVICVETLSNLYLTLRFLVPLVKVHCTGEGLLHPLRGLVTRTVIGAALTTVSVLTTKMTLAFFNGEPAWLCCLTCKFDAFTTACVLHWVTARDHKEQQRKPGSVELAMPEHLRTVSISRPEDVKIPCDGTMTRWPSADESSSMSKQDNDKLRK